MRHALPSGFVLVVILSCTAPAAAQQWTPLGGRAFINVNGGHQGPSRDLIQRVAFELYEENATYETRQRIDAGAMLDVSAGYRVWRQFGVGVGYSSFSDRDQADVAGQLPHPLVFSRLRSFTAGAPGLAHRTSAFHLQALWVQPLARRLDLSVSAGPSFFRARQSFVGGVSFRDGNVPGERIPGGAVIVEGLQIVGTRATATGVNVGADLSYLLTPSLGAGIFVRYAGASTTFTVPNGARVGVSLGGAQTGAGLRVRF